MILSNIEDDDVIITSMHVVGFLFYNNKVDIGDNIILTREPLCCFDKWTISVTFMVGDTIGCVARNHSVALGPVLDFFLRNESSVTPAYIMGKYKWTRAGQGYPIDALIIIQVPLRLHIIGILDQWNINWRSVQTKKERPCGGRYMYICAFFQDIP
eukprot:6283935-Ditylum_brightwellii.AAC.1